MIDVRRCSPSDAAVLGRLLWEFNTEFGSDTDPADVLTERFARLLERDDAIALLAGEDDGFAFLTLRPAIWYDGPVSQLEELYVAPALRDQGSAQPSSTPPGGWCSSSGRRRCTSTSTRSTRTPGGSTSATASSTSRREGMDYRMLCYIGPTDSPS